MVRYIKPSPWDIFQQLKMMSSQFTEDKIEVALKGYSAFPTRKICIKTKLEYYFYLSVCQKSKTLLTLY